MLGRTSFIRDGRSDSTHFIDRKANVEVRYPVPVFAAVFLNQGHQHTTGVQGVFAAVPWQNFQPILGIHPKCA